MRSHLARLLAVIVLGWPAGLGAQATAPERPALARARQILTDTMQALGAPGASIAVMLDGRLIWSEGFGLADIEQQVPVTPKTVFRIGSVSKPLTAAALGLLVQQGKVGLDDEVQRYVPTFPRKQFPVTVRQAAGHLAGIRHYRNGEMGNMKHFGTVLQGLDMFSADSLLAEPGTRFIYSSYSWNLIAAVIEGASGEPFLSFMRKAVFEPAGMTHTYPEFADSIIPHRADFYTYSRSQQRMLNAPYVDNSYKWAGGGFLSTSEDLARFGQAMLDHTLLSSETVQLLWTSMVTRDGKQTGYGIGWSINGGEGEPRRVGHTGGAMGGTATLQIYPAQRLVIALLVNSDRTFIGIAPTIASILLAP